MIEGIQNGSALARAALEAAQRSQQSAAARLDGVLAEGLAPPGAPATFESQQASFETKMGDALRSAVRSVDAELQSAQRLPVELVAGELTDFHAVAAQIKRAELTFKFALEVRNKLIDAYRETMRMSV
jgi:flagellar hook-basal body complex protein FliE